MGRISMPQGKGSQMHNRREYAKYGRPLPDNIDASRTAENVVIVDRDLHELYDELFGDAVEQYNAKQKRADRKIADYVDKIANSKNGENLFYEDVLQYGAKEDFVDPKMRDIAKKCLQIYAETFEKRNPCLHLLGAYIHMDEASPHLHIDWVPAASGYKRGLSVRNSLDKALKEMGFVPEKEDRYHNATMLWKARERAYFADICREHGLVVEKEERGRGKSLSPAEYARAKDEMTKSLEQEKQVAQKKVDDLEHEVKRLNKAVQKRSKKVSRLEEQATKIENEVTWKTAELATNQQRVAELDEDIEKRKRKRSELENEVQGLTVHVGSIKALEDEIEDAKKAYDSIVEHGTEINDAVVTGFRDAEPVTFGRNRGLMKVLLPKEAYTGLVTLISKSHVFAHAYDAVAGLESRVEDVLTTAKNYYRQAQNALQEARETLLQAKGIESGETYKNEEKKLADLSSKKKSLSRDVDDLEYKRESLSYDCDDLQEAKEALLRDVKDIQVTKYEKAYIKRYRDDFDDFVAKQKRRERSYDDWER